MVGPSAVQVARYILGFAWIYHGTFPKLLQVAPLEKALTATLGFSNETSHLITLSAGVGEVLFGTLLIVFYRVKTLIVFNMAALVILCGFVAIQMPALLIEAFNPVTTNLALIGLSYTLLKQAE